MEDRVRDHGARAIIADGVASVGEIGLSQRVYAVLEQRSLELRRSDVDGLRLYDDTVAAATLRPILYTGTDTRLAVARILTMLIQSDAYMKAPDAAVLASTTYALLQLSPIPAADLASDPSASDQSRWLALRALIPYEDSTAVYLPTASAAICILAAKADAVADIAPKDSSNPYPMLSEPDLSSLGRILYASGERRSRHLPIPAFREILRPGDAISQEIERDWPFLW